MDNQLHFQFIKDKKESNIISHAKRELAAIGYDLNDKEDGPNKWMLGNILELLSVFSEQGHSGFSAPECVRLFTKLASYEPLCPIQGTDDEWVEVSENLWQNVRCSHIFKDELGCAYDINGKVFVEPNGCAYTNGKSRVNVTFPYTPKTEYVKVDDEGKEIPKSTIEILNQNT